MIKYDRKINKIYYFFMIVISKGQSFKNSLISIAK